MSVPAGWKLNGEALSVLKQACSSHSITIKYHVTTQGGAGGKKRVPTAVSGAPDTCRIVELSAFDSAELSTPDYKVTHLAIFEKNPLVETGYWIEYGSTPRYIWVRAVKNENDLDQMWTVHCEEKKPGDG